MEAINEYRLSCLNGESLPKLDTFYTDILTWWADDRRTKNVRHVLKVQGMIFYLKPSDAERAILVEHAERLKKCKLFSHERRVQVSLLHIIEKQHDLSLLNLPKLPEFEMDSFSKLYKIILDN
tara:strand:+ start:300 stop:668 length:369 start_codon:yes stop_codon:yes gene_type:complete